MAESINGTRVMARENLFKTTMLVSKVPYPWASKLRKWIIALSTILFDTILFYIGSFYLSLLRTVTVISLNRRGKLIVAFCIAVFMISIFGVGTAKANQRVREEGEESSKNFWKKPSLNEKRNSVSNSHDNWLFIFGSK